MLEGAGRHNCTIAHLVSDNTKSSDRLKQGLSHTQFTMPYCITSCVQIAVVLEDEAGRLIWSGLVSAPGAVAFYCMFPMNIAIL